MNTLDDLRGTLERHADDLHDTERYVRPVAIRARIRAVRRRRAGVVAAVTAMVLAGATATVAGLRSPDDVKPAGPVVAGVDVPQDVRVSGFPYELTDVHALGGHRTLHLAKAKDDRAVVLAASDLGSGSATLYSSDEPVARVRGSEQVAVPTWVGATSVDLEVRFDGTPAGARAGVAVYRATGDLAPGTTDGTAVFRGTLGGEPRLAAGFSEPGESSLELDARGALAEMRFVFYCTGDRHLWLNVAVDGRGPMGSSCGEAETDAATDSSTSFPGGSTQVRAHHIRVYLSRGATGPAVDPQGVTFGLGVYHRSSAPREVLGTQVDNRVEFGGRTWVLDEVRPAPSTIDTADGDRLLYLAGRGQEVSVNWTGRLDAEHSSTMGGGHGTAVMSAGVLLAGDRYRVTVHGGEGRLLVYRPE